jgi:hypothetical protein
MTPDRHPDCVQVVTTDDVDVFSAFNMAADTLHPSNTKTRGLLWIPRDDIARAATTHEKAQDCNRAYFWSLNNFHRGLIINHLQNDPRVDFTLGQPDEDNTDDHGDLQISLSTNHADDAAKDADFPHIDGITNGNPDPHAIRAIRLLYGSIGQGPRRRAAGTIIYEGQLDSTDVDFGGRVLSPGIIGKRGADKLNQAWQVIHHNAILFINIGGPVSCQLPHEAQTIPVDPKITPQTPTLITRVIETYDFSTKS